MREQCGVTVVGKGDTEGGCEWAIFPNECSGAKVVQSGGYDYGSWIAFCAEISEEDYKKLLAYDSLSFEQKRALEDNLHAKYPQKEYEVL